MLGILGISAVAIYQYTRHNLYQQLDRRLETLAQAASHSLVPIKAHYLKREQKGLVGNPPDSKTRCYLDDDGDLDIPWQHLRQPNQGIEWFDAQKRLVGNVGTLFNQLPPIPGWQFGLGGKIRSVTLPAYSENNGNKQLEGYIRASQVTDEIEAILARLRWGLGIGGIGVISLTGLGGIWLTRKSLKPVEQSFEQLKQFTANAAHELRSPLAAIKTSVQVMEYYPERIHPQDRKKIAAIATTTDHTIELVEDLLFLSRLDSLDTVETAKTWVRLSVTEILEDLIELLQSSAQAKNITLESSLLPDVTVRGNGAELSRLFRNILENALQYTPAGGKVSVIMKREKQNILVKIQDTGVGIAAENLASIFDRFWRADKARARRAGGMGMGLAIARAIAENHQGKIFVTSQLGIGSCFTVKLPIN
ncbi:MAG: sensor histidine kinase [Cyanobacteria bacterium J083]|nr:MAG: sensor histidine kinase [Cyanobacteria bacterium J083]